MNVKVDATPDLAWPMFGNDPLATALLRPLDYLSASAARSFEPNRVHKQPVGTVAADHQDR